MDAAIISSIFHLLLSSQEYALATDSFEVIIATSECS
jgi:hypothetical protein